MRDVQEQTLDLTRRVNERSREYDTWNDRQKKSWTAGKVGKELAEVFVPNPEHLKPLFEQTLELRDRLQKSINDQPALFQEVDATVARIKQIAADMQAAKEKGHAGVVRSLNGKMDAERAKLEGLKKEMQLIHKRNAQWQAGSQALTTTAGMTATEYIGKARMVYQVGKSGAQFLKPEPGFRRTAVFEPKKGGGGNREFYVVDKDGNIQELKGADAPDFKPGKGQMVVSRDPYTGKITERGFGPGGRGQSLTVGQKNLLRQQAAKGLAGKPVRTIDPGRRYAGPSGLTTTEDGSITYRAGDEKPPAFEAPKKPAQMPRSLRELKDMVESERLSKMVRDKPGPAQQKAAAVGEIAERMRQGEKPAFTRRDLPHAEKDWIEQDRALHPPRTGDRRFYNTEEILGRSADERARAIASRHPDFARIDKAIREAYRESGAARGADDVLNPEPGQRFMDLAAKKGVRPQDWDNWRKAMEEGDWSPARQERPRTVSAGQSAQAGLEVEAEAAGQGPLPKAGAATRVPDPKAGAATRVPDPKPPAPPAPRDAASAPAAPAESAGPAPRKPGDLKELVPQRETFRSERARQNYERLMEGKEPDFEGAVDDANEPAGWAARDKARTGGRVETPADRLEYWRERDPGFKQMQKVFEKAEGDARNQVIREILPEVEDQMKSDGWAPGSPGYEDELGKRLGADLRIHSGERVQQQYHENLLRRQPDLTKFEEQQYFKKLYDYSNTPIPTEEAPPAPATPSAPAVQAPSARPALSRTAAPPAASGSPAEPGAPQPAGRSPWKTVIGSAPPEPSGETPLARAGNRLSFARMLQGFLKRPE